MAGIGRKDTFKKIYGKVKFNNKIFYNYGHKLLPNHDFFFLYVIKRFFIFRYKHIIIMTIK